MIALAVVADQWPTAAGAMPNDTPILIDAAGIYHHPESRCVVGINGGRIVPLVSALVYGHACKCWSFASTR